MLEEALPWALRLARGVFGHDRRVIHQIEVRDEEGGFGTRFEWAMPEVVERQLFPLGYSEGQRPLSYDDEDFAAQVEAHVAVVDALVEGRVPGLREACRELDTELSVGPCNAAAALARAVRLEGVSLEGRGDRQALERFVELEREHGERW